MKKISTIQKRKLLDQLFELKFVKNLEDLTIYDNRHSYKDFWDLWCSLSGKFSFKDLDLPEVKEIAYNSLRSMNRGFYKKNDKNEQRRLDIMKRREMGARHLDQVNEVVINETVEDVTFDEMQRCLIILQDIVNK